MYSKQQYDSDKKIFNKEKNWNQRFILDKIPKFDAYNDINYLSLGLLKSKIRYEERIKKDDTQSKYAGRLYSSNYIKPKSTSKFQKQKEYNFYQNSFKNIDRKRNPSMRISLEPTLNLKKKVNSYKALNTFHYQGTLNTQNFAGSPTFNYMPDYKDKNMKFNIRNIICRDDPEIAEQYELVRELWAKLGVTKKYINNFDYILNGKKSRDAIFDLIVGEKKQMKMFRLELMKVISEITKRENKINDLKQFIKTYKKVNELIKMKEKENIKNKDDIDNNDNKETKNTKNVGEVNKELIENDIHDCLKSLRLRTINAVNILKKFKNSYYNLFNNKINLEFIKLKYGFDDKYLSKIKNDLNFLKDSAINKLYHFSEKGGDPFLLCISDKCGNPSDVPQYRQLPITNEILSIVKSFKFSLEQEEVFTMIKNKNEYYENNNSNMLYKNNKYNNNINGSYNNDYSNTFNNNLYNNNYNNKYNSYNINNNNYNNNLPINNNNEQLYNNNKNEINENLLSANFKGNVENEKLKLKIQNEYKNVFFNTEDYDNYNINQYPSINSQEMNNKEEKKYELPGMNSKQFYRHLAKYTKIKRELFPPFNKELIKEEVQKNIIQTIEERINKIENDFRTKMDEKLQKEENKIKEEENRIKNEKAKIEKLKNEEEAERKKKEDKYFKFEEERIKRKNKDKKKKEENERFTKRDNDIFLREMQIKFMKEVDERFKKENERQLKLKKEEIIEAEEKEKERKEELERIKNDEYEKIKRGDVLVDLRSENEHDKNRSDINSEINDNNEKFFTNSINNNNNLDKDNNDNSEINKKDYISNNQEKNNNEIGNNNDNDNDNDNEIENKKNDIKNNSEENNSINNKKNINFKNENNDKQSENDDKQSISEEIQENIDN